jgi:hypothetical protein
MAKAMKMPLSNEQQTGGENDRLTDQVFIAPPAREKMDTDYFFLLFPHNSMETTTVTAASAVTGDMGEYVVFVSTGIVVSEGIPVSDMVPVTSVGC